MVNWILMSRKVKFQKKYLNIILSFSHILLNGTPTTCNYNINIILKKLKNNHKHSSDDTSQSTGELNI